jgi:hypothetical protein
MYAISAVPAFDTFVCVVSLFATLTPYQTFVSTFLSCFGIAGRASGRVPFVTDRLQPDVDFRLWDGAAVCDDSPAAADPCNTFKADKVLGRSSDIFDQSGIITLLCRWVKL